MSRFRVVLPAVLLLFATAAVAQSDTEQGLESPVEAPAPVVDYSMEVRLEESGDGPILHGALTVTWTNRGAVATRELLWHVYNNAWESAESVFLKEARRQGSMELPRGWGSTEVENVRLVTLDPVPGVAVAGDTPLPWNYLPQPGAPNDRTVARVELPEAVAPGASVTVALDFVTKLPPAYRRSGWGGEGYIHAVQWFPKLGVFEEFDANRDGVKEWAWNCLPYHYLSEFYADFGNWQLELTLPARYDGKVVATGSIIEGWPRVADDKVLYRFEAERVHDFAWTGDPEARLIEREFREENWRDIDEEQRVARALDLTVEEIRPGPVTMLLLLQPEHEEYEERYFTAIAKSLYYFGLWYGAYPYPTISCVDPANDARATGGMEYPRLFTGGVSRGNHERTASPEGVTVHEFGHQYWYGLVGNDEFRHAWMDEGFNTFSTQRVLQKGWPPTLATYSVLGKQYPGKAPMSLPRFEAGDIRALAGMERWESPELRFIPEASLELRHDNPLMRWAVELPPVTYWPEVTANPVHRARRSHPSDWGQPLSQPTYDMFEDGLRRVNAYNRPGMTLETIARLMGEERWIPMIREYHLTWRYRHPQPSDFFAMVEKHGVGAFLSAGDMVVGIDWADFWRQAYHGEARMDFAAHRLANHANEDGGFDVVASVRRVGGFRVPVEIRIHWSDGSATDYVWEGEGPVWDLHLEGSELRAERLQVDPRRLLMLDRDWLNNEIRIDPGTRRAGAAALRVLLWAQQVLHYYGGAG